MPEKITNEFLQEDRDHRNKFHKSTIEHIKKAIEDIQTGDRESTRENVRKGMADAKEAFKSPSQGLVVKYLSDYNDAKNLRQLDDAYPALFDIFNLLHDPAVDEEVISAKLSQCLNNLSQNFD